MKNTLGHDNESEILTLIARLRDSNCDILEFRDNQILFEITLKYHHTVPVSNTSTQKIKFTLKREIDEAGYKYYFEQLNGDVIREISLKDGFIIWSLLEEKYDAIRSCFNCKKLHSFQGEGDVVCHVYCSEKDEIDYTFSNSLDPKRIAKECPFYEKD